MKLFLKSIVLPGVLSILTLISISSCLPDVGEPVSSLNFKFHIFGLDSTMTAGADSLDVNRVRLIQGESFFTIDSDSTAPVSGFVCQMNFSDVITTRTLYRSGFPKFIFTDFTFKIIRAKGVENDSGEPPFNPDEIFTSEGSYSIIVEGTYNDEDFTFKASKGFDFDLPLIPPIAVSEESKNYALLLSTDLEEWFENDTGDGFIDPSDAANTTAIYNNIETSFEIEQFPPNQ